ncbi:MAG: tetratricopeptide repeat protein [Desulfobacteraceae bacterium]|nr:tetratricopeptide repeat protein [Desulfobacteraceae bacterium]
MDEIETGIIIYEKLSAINKKNIPYFFPAKIADKITIDMTANEKINFYCKYLDINSSDLVLKNMLTDLFFENKNYRKAQEGYLSILKQQKESESSAIYFKLGICEYHLGHFEAALKYFKKAKRMGHNVPKSYIKMIHEKVKMRKIRGHDKKNPGT